MPGRPCTICVDASKARLAAELIASGASDQAVADRLGVGRMAANRHRKNHVEAPAKALVAAANKGIDVREQRAEMLAAAEAGDPSAFVALASIVADLRKVHERLERTAYAAEQDNQRLAVASLSAQQLRAAEVRARVGGVGGYAPQKGRDGSEVPTFSLTINFGDGRTEQIVATPIRPTIDAEPVPMTDLDDGGD